MLGIAGCVPSRGIPGFLEYVEIDTAHFMGNFPESCELHALANPIGGYAPVAGVEWTRIMSRTPLGPHRQHFFQLDNVAGRAYTHVKLTIYPDGGVKRVRIIGRRAESGTILSNTEHARRFSVSAALNGTTAIDESRHLNGNAHFNGSSDDGDDVAYTVVATNSRALPSTINEESHRGVTLIPALPLTPEAFAPFGNVVQAYADVHAAPRGTKITAANQGTALKFHKLAPILSSYPPGSKANANLSVYRCKPLEGIAGAGECVVRVLERHPYTNQAFVPMGGAGSYLVVVAKNGLDDQPDVGTLRAFVASAAQTVVYATAIWRELS
jgi:allantoicase